MLRVAGGITTPMGFRAAGAHVGLRRKRKDLAIVFSDVPAVAAGVFTTNVVKAAPVQWTQAVVNSGNKVKAILVNSGQANSCTGPQGFDHCQTMVETAAQSLQCAPEEILIASTGLIGVPIPIEKAVPGIQSLSKELSAQMDGGMLAAEAIMTTDSFVKQFAVQIDIGGKPVRIGAMAKGSGMVHPNMATMLSFITSDVNISQELLQQAMRQSVFKTYNMISVDGDTSTNDMALVLANGLAGNDLIDDATSTEYALFAQCLHAVNEHLAKQIARDGEGATKFLEVGIAGTETVEEAQKLARAVVSSSLVKTALFGQDPNWGRILAALGSGGVSFDPLKVCIQFASSAGKLMLMQGGTPVSFEHSFAKAVLSEKDIRIAIDLKSGDCGATAWGCDLTYDYVKMNGAYRAS